MLWRLRVEVRDCLEKVNKYVNSGRGKDECDGKWE